MRAPSPSPRSCPALRRALRPLLPLVAVVIVVAVALVPTCQAQRLPATSGRGGDAVDAPLRAEAEPRRGGAGPKDPPKVRSLVLRPTSTLLLFDDDAIAGRNDDDEERAGVLTRHLLGRWSGTSSRSSSPGAVVAGVYAALQRLPPLPGAVPDSSSAHGTGSLRMRGAGLRLHGALGSDSASSDKKMILAERHNGLVDEFNARRHFSRFEWDRLRRLRQVDQQHHRQLRQLQLEDNASGQMFPGRELHVPMTMFDSLGNPHMGVAHCTVTNSTDTTTTTTTTESCEMVLSNMAANGGNCATKEYGCDEVANLYGPLLAAGGADDLPDRISCVEGVEDWSLMLELGDPPADHDLEDEHGADEHAEPGAGGQQQVCVAVRVHTYAIAAAEAEAQAEAPEVPPEAPDAASPPAGGPEAEAAEAEATEAAEAAAPEEAPPANEEGAAQDAAAEAEAPAPDAEAANEGAQEQVSPEAAAPDAAAAAGPEAGAEPSAPDADAAAAAAAPEAAAEAQEAPQEAQEEGAPPAPDATDAGDAPADPTAQTTTTAGAEDSPTDDVAEDLAAQQVAEMYQGVGPVITNATTDGGSPNEGGEAGPEDEGGAEAEAAVAEPEAGAEPDAAAADAVAEPEAGDAAAEAAAAGEEGPTDDAGTEAAAAAAEDAAPPAEGEAAPAAGEEQPAAPEDAATNPGEGQPPTDATAATTGEEPVDVSAAAAAASEAEAPAAPDAAAAEGPGEAEAAVLAPEAGAEAGAAAPEEATAAPPDAATGEGGPADAAAAPAAAAAAAAEESAPDPQASPGGEAEAASEAEAAMAELVDPAAEAAAEAFATAQAAACESNSECAAAGLIGDCCPTHAGGAYLECCDAYNVTAPDDVPPPLPLPSSSACEANPQCAEENISGECCPTAVGTYLSCCGNGDGDGTGAVPPDDNDDGDAAAAAAPATPATTATPEDIAQAAAAANQPSGPAGGDAPEIVPPVPEQYGGQAGLEPPTFPPNAQQEEGGVEATHPQDIIVDNEPIEATAVEAAVPVDPRTSPGTSGGDDTAAAMTGGLLNSYQNVPLSQGYGTHYATVWVGSPRPQRQSVIVDTGSHYTAFPCRPECSRCGEEHHTDRLFDPNLSTSFHALTCSECEAGGSCRGGKCQFSQSYTEGSSWSAYQAKDRFFCGGNGPESAEDPVDLSYAIDFTFGCQTSETGLFITQLADGIMGMAANDATLTKRMHDAGKLEHLMFAMCFRRELKVSKDGVHAGVLTMGGVDSRLDSTPMLYARNTVGRGWFTVKVRNVYLRSNGGQSAMADSSDQHVTKIPINFAQINSGKGVIVDSGTTDTYFHRSLAAPFAAAFKQITGRTHSNRPIKITREELLALPTLLVQLDANDDTVDPSMGPVDAIPGLAGGLDPTRPADVILAIPATHYMEYTPDKDEYTSRLYFSEGQGGVLGANAMMGHNILFDWENNRVGFAESDCEFGAAASEADGGAADEKKGVDADCILGVPSIDEKCVESVDLTQCHGEDDSTMLRGTEKWTMVVESPGAPGGKSCEEVVLINRPPDGGDEPPVVLCDGNGLCFDIRPCEMTCADAEAIGAIDVVPIGEGTQGSDENASFDDFQPCGDNLWGACEYTCVQTKIASTLMSDGFCHEDEAMRVTRPCHIDACGRSDPCRVPFVVHAVMVFRGANAPLWSKRAEDKFMSAFADAVNSKKSTGDELFGPGDVKVLMASPWHESDDTDRPAMGMKVIVEISIYNPNARLPEGYVYEPITEEKASAIAANATSAGGPKETFENMITKVKAVWHDWTKPLSICEEGDVYNLAHNALDVHLELERPLFMDELIKALRKEEGSKVHFSSPFTPIFEQRSFAEDSEFLSSWTIKSGIGGGKLHQRPIPTIQGFNKETIMYYVTNIPFIVVVLSLLVFVCCCGMCFGSKCARGRQDRLQMEKIMKAIQERNADKARGRYEKIGANGNVANHEDDDDEHEISFGGNTGYKDHPEGGDLDEAGDLELAEMESEEDRMSRLKNEL